MDTRLLGRGRVAQVSYHARRWRVCSVQLSALFVLRAQRQAVASPTRGSGSYLGKLPANASCRLRSQEGHNARRDNADKLKTIPCSASWEISTPSSARVPLKVPITIKPNRGARSDPAVPVTSNNNPKKVYQNRKTPPETAIFTRKSLPGGQDQDETPSSSHLVVQLPGRREPGPPDLLQPRHQPVLEAHPQKPGLINDGFSDLVLCCRGSEYNGRNEINPKAIAGEE